MANTDQIRGTASAVKVVKKSPVAKKSPVGVPVQGGRVRRAAKPTPTRSWLRCLRPRLFAITTTKSVAAKKKPKPESVKSWLRILRPRKWTALVVRIPVLAAPDPYFRTRSLSISVTGSEKNEKDCKRGKTKFVCPVLTVN